MSQPFSAPIKDLGGFLCQSGTWEAKPTEEQVDAVNYTDLDVRQDAAVRAFLRLQRAGVTWDDDDGFVARLNENPAFAMTAHKFARIDAFRKLRGRVKNNEPGGPRFRRWSLPTRDLSQVNEDEMGYWLPEEIAAYEEAMIDPNWDAEFEEIECNWQGELAAVEEHGTCAQKEAVKMMRWLYEKKARGEPTDTNAIRCKLRRLRRETGWELNVRLL